MKNFCYVSSFGYGFLTFCSPLENTGAALSISSDLVLEFKAELEDRKKTAASYILSTNAILKTRVYKLVPVLFSNLKRYERQLS